MKFPFLSALLVALCCTTVAQAGGPTIVETDPVPNPPAQPAAGADWSGPYVGLTYGQTSTDFTLPSGPFAFTDGDTAGVYAGYLWQRGALVYGAELAYASVSGAEIVGFPLDRITHTIDLKARLGVLANRTLFYGVLGYSRAHYKDTTLPPPRDINLDGLAYGLGAEFAVSEKLTMGLEYMSRDGSGAASDNPAIIGNSTFDTLNLRVGLSF
ncbi:MAG: porin family protein [Tabrizicola sp.]|nr:porin family protein [Tabrizicola sp.]